MTLRLVSLLLLLLGTALSLFALRRGQPWGKPGIAVCALLALLAALWNLATPGRPPVLQKGLDNGELMLSVEGEVLGHYLAKQFAGGRAVIFGNPSAGRNEAGLATLQKSLESTLTVTLASTFQPSAKNAPQRTGYDAYVQEQAGQADVVILADHHMNLLRVLRNMKEPKAPPIAVLHADSVTFPMRALLNQNVLTAATLYRALPDTQKRVKKQGTLDHDYAIRLFTVVTPENFREFLAD